MEQRRVTLMGLDVVDDLRGSNCLRPETELAQWLKRQLS